MKNLKKWWLWVLIVVIIAFGVAGCVENGSEKNDPTEDVSDVQNESSQDTDASEEAPSETQAPETEAPETEEKKEDNIYAVGDSFEANGLKISFDSAERWESDNMFNQPDDGNIYIRVHISAENTSNSDRSVYSGNFSCYADGNATDSPYVGDDTLGYDTLSSGRKTDGYVYFEVPADSQTVEIEYETSFWTDKKAILRLTLSDI